MASTNPVPSRAALNALRGVVFTTSCSVFLLAEERRRRLKIARAAIDNARKLHTVRSNRGPIALTENHGSWESRYSDISDEVLALSAGPTPRTSTRRRKRSQLIGTVSTGDNEVSFGEPLPSEAQHDHRANWTSGLSLADRLAGELDLTSTNNMQYNDQGSSRSFPQNKGWKVPLSFAQAKTAAPTINENSCMVGEGEVKRDLPTPDTVENRGVGTTRFGEIVASSVESAVTYLEKTSRNSSGFIRPYYDDAVIALEQLLADLESDASDSTATSEKIDHAIAIMERVSSFGIPLPKASKALQAQGMRLFSAVGVLQPSLLTRLLPAMLLMTRDCLKVLVPFMEYAQAANSRTVVRTMLEHLSQQRVRFGWTRGMLIHRLLSRHAKNQETFGPCKQLYKLLQESGLFDDFGLQQSTQYKIRRLVARLALADGDDGFARQEVRQMYETNSDACKADGKLQMAIITRKAQLGHWNEVLSEVRALQELTGMDSAAFQSFLSRVTDLFQQSHSPEELEAYIRRAAPACCLQLKSRWVFAVMDALARRQQVEPLFDWLQFCADAGLQMDRAFSEKFLLRCRKYWSFSDKTTSELARQLGISDGELQAFQNKRNGALRSTTLCSQLNDLVSAEQYDQALDIYGTARQNGEHITVACLRFAVLAHLKRDVPNLAEAIELVRAAKEAGIDISEALTPLLMMRLERGDDPHLLIDEALRMGARIHDSAYNRAAQAMSANGNHRAAADICQVAAQQNGNGNLLYNEYNFANLVFAYTGLASYRALTSLLSGFTSEAQWWHGSRRCKESIKLAMKTTAMRAVAHSQDNGTHCDALHSLDDALLHVKRCRSTREHRRAVTETYVRIVRSSNLPESQRLHQRSKPALRSKGLIAMHTSAQTVRGLATTGASG